MKQLRKRHLLIWRMLAILLPAGIIIAWIAVPNAALQPLLQPEHTSPLPLILSKAINRQYAVSIRASEDTSLLQLEWINGEILQYPTATIYAEDSTAGSINEMKLVGRIEARGNWYFPLDSTFRHARSTRLLLYDFIHRQIIDTINLLP